MVEDDEQIDLETFYSQFIRPERGTATVVAQANDAAAEARLSSLLASIETRSARPRCRQASASQMKMIFHPARSWV